MAKNMNMNIVSPLYTKLKIAMPSIKYNNVGIGELPMTNTNDTRDTMNANKQRPMKHLNEYTLFLILERERVHKLRQLYQGKVPVVQKKHKQEDTALPKFPPRYQCLRDLSADWFVSELKKHKRVVSFRDSNKEHWTESLDQCTKTFLEDMVHILRDVLEDKERRSSSRSSSSNPLPCMPSLCSPTNIPNSDNIKSMNHRRSMTITPPASPLTLILPVSEDSLLPLEQHARSDDARRKVVDMSDEEIMTLWDTCI